MIIIHRHMTRLVVYIHRSTYALSPGQVQEVTFSCKPLIGTHAMPAGPQPQNIYYNSIYQLVRKPRKHTKKSASSYYRRIILMAAIFQATFSKAALATYAALMDISGLISI